MNEVEAEKTQKHRVAFIIGVSGCGKSTIGLELAHRWNVAFADADDFHSESNKDKMGAKIPLTDEDRRPWLASLHSFVRTQLVANDLVVACSALKQSYRDQLSDSIESQCDWVLLEGSFELIQQRLSARKKHYMTSDLLQSQFDILEIPINAIRIDISEPSEAIVEHLDQVRRARR